MVSLQGVGEGQTQTGRRRLTVAEASEVLGVTVEAVRGRIKRGTLDHERTDKGVFVFLEADQTIDPPRPDTDLAADQPQSDSAALISAKDETIAALREQLEAERQAHAEARRLLMAALERIPPQIEAREGHVNPPSRSRMSRRGQRAPPRCLIRGSGGSTETLVAEDVRR